MADSNLGIQADQARNILLGQLIAAVQALVPASVVGPQYNSAFSANGDYTVGDTDYSIFANASAGNLTITIPAAGGVGTEGRILNVKKTDGTGNTVTVTDGTTTFVISIPGTSLQMQCHGSVWFLI